MEILLTAGRLSAIALTPVLYQSDIYPCFGGYFIELTVERFQSLAKESDP